MADRLVILGCKGGPAIRPGGPNPTSSLLELGDRRIVVDCGLGVTRGLVDAGVDLRSLHMVWITHLHSDHLLELGPLLHTAWTSGLDRAVTVFGPEGTGDYWRHFLASMAFDNAIRVDDEGRRPLEELVTVRSYGAGTALADEALRVEALRVKHPPVTDTFALRFESRGKSLTFSADTAFFEPLADFARGSDVLVHEAMLGEGVDALVARTGLGEQLRAHLHNSHCLAEDAARIAAQAGVRHLVLHHLIPADDPAFSPRDFRDRAARHFDGKISVGRDGLEIELEGEPNAA